MQIARKVLRYRLSKIKKRGQGNQVLHVQLICVVSESHPPAKELKR